MGERGPRLEIDGEPDSLEVGLKDNPGCKLEGRWGVAGMGEIELSSLLDEPPATRGICCVVYTCLEASESDRDLGEVRFRGSRRLFISDEESAFPLDSPSPARCDNCSLSLLSNRGAEKLRAKVKEVADDIMVAIRA